MTLVCEFCLIFGHHFGHPAITVEHWRWHFKILVRSNLILCRFLSSSTEVPSDEGYPDIEVDVDHVDNENVWYRMAGDRDN